MAMIDILKLNAELDAMIARQDTEVEELENEVEATREEQFANMCEQLRQLQEMFDSLGADRMKVRTGIPATMRMMGGNVMGAGVYTLRFDRNQWAVGVYNDGNGYIGERFCGYLNFRGCEATFCNIKRKINVDKLGIEIDEFLDTWEQQFSKFYQNFEEGCVKLIKAKAEKANARYEEAKRKHEEVCG